MNILTAFVSTMVGLIVIGTLSYELHFEPKARAKEECIVEVTALATEDGTPAGSRISGFAYGGMTYPTRKQAQDACMDHKDLINKKSMF